MTINGVVFYMLALVLHHRGSDVVKPSAQLLFTIAPFAMEFMAAGAGPVTVARRAYAALFGAVQQQAAMVAFVHVFRTLALIFLLLLPLILLMRRPHRPDGPMPAH